MLEKDLNIVNVEGRDTIMYNKDRKNFNSIIITRVMKTNNVELMCSQGFKQVRMNPSRKGLTIDMNMNLENINQGGNKIWQL